MKQCTEVNLVEEGLGGLLPAGPQGWPLKFVQNVADATGASPFSAGQPGCCLLHILHLSDPSRNRDTKCHSMRMTLHPPDKQTQFHYSLHQLRLE